MFLPHARQTPENCRVLRGDRNIIRIHCGLEGEENLISDLESAFEKL